MKINKELALDIIWKNIAIIIIHSLASYIAIKYIGLGQFAVTPIFPPAGIAFALTVLWGFRVLPGLWLATIGANFLLSHHLFASIIVGSGNVLQTVIGVLILQIFTKTKTPFYSPAKVAIFIFGSAFFSCLFNSFIATSAYYFYGFIKASDFFITWLNWWLADSIGIITFASVILVWYQAKIILTWQKITELIILLILLSLSVILINEYHWPLAHMLLGFSIWSAMRFRAQITSLISLIISCLVIYWGSEWYYTYRGVNEIEDKLFAQTFVAMTFFISLILSAIFAQRERGREKLLKANEGLETEVKQRTHDLVIKNTDLQKAITDLKNAQTQLVQAEKMSALGILTAGIAHEINNAVNFISANINPLKNDIDDLTQALNQCVHILTHPNEISIDVSKFVTDLNLDFILKETQALLDGIKDGAQRTTTIVKDLRAFSRLDAAELKYANIHQSIDSTLNLLKSNYKDRINIIKNYNATTEIQCHPGRLNQVFMNLLMNAIQATPDKGEITITTTSNDKQVCISIKDTGTGMSKETLDQIFEPFFTTKEVGQGTGLGLSISYNIIQEHHGSIKVSSELNKGSEFIICLPLIFP